MAKPKFTPEEVSRAVRECHGLLYMTAERLGCDPSTVRRYADRHKSVQEAFAERRGWRVDRAECRLHEAVEKGEAYAVCFTLKTQGKSRGYIERSEVTGADGTPLVVPYIEVARPHADTLPTTAVAPV